MEWCVSTFRAEFGLRMLTGIQRVVTQAVHEVLTRETRTEAVDE